MKQLLTYLKESTQAAGKPKDKKELQKIILQRIQQDGPECDLNDIDVSHITDMSYLFDAGTNKIFKDFNGDISQWNVSNVKTMQSMFYRCAKFNGDISNWDVSNVINMEASFAHCENFKQDLNSWDVSNVKYMTYAFYNCTTQPKWYDKNRWES